MGGNFGDELLLIYAHAQGRKDFEVEFAERRKAETGDGFVQHRAPAEDAHDDLGDKMTINEGELVEKARMEEFHGVRRLALNAQQYVECSRACRGNRHIR